MKLSTKILFLPFLLFTLSCEFKQVNDDAKSYCDCKAKQYEGKTVDGECSKLLAKLNKKYEYFPDEYEMLAEKIAECLAE